MCWGGLSGFGCAVCAVMCGCLLLRPRGVLYLCECKLGLRRGKITYENLGLGWVCMYETRHLASTFVRLLSFLAYQKVVLKLRSQLDMVCH
ncbi:hypothetical protein F5B21DRAFT_477647 [Xylaria acuta]|nr:hypothetical protein F5B21DRAFT_477647 [Xylaria acuta]